MLGWMARDAEAKSLGPLSSETLTSEGRGASLCQPVFTKNRRNRNLPQHVPATRVANEKNRLCHLMSPWFCSDGAVDFASTAGLLTCEAGSPTIASGTAAHEARRFKDKRVDHERDQSIARWGVIGG